jgi:hypothetical protein
VKKYQFVFLIFIFSISIGNGQTNIYHPFPDSVIWRVDYNFDFPFQYPCVKHYYFEYYATGDTVINSTIYRKIYLNGVYDTSSCMGQPYYLPMVGYRGALKTQP